MRWILFLPFLGLLFSCSNPGSKESSHATLQDSIQFWADTAKDNKDLPLKERSAMVNNAYAKNLNVTNNYEQVKNLSRISLAYKQLADTLNFKKTNSELMRLAQAIGDPIAQGEAHWDMGLYFRRTQPDSAFYHYNEAYTLFRSVELGDKSYYPGRMLLAIASVKDNVKDYVGAEKDITAAIEEFKRIGAKERLFEAYNHLGIILVAVKKYDKALEYYAKAEEFIQYAKRKKQPEYKISLLNNKASAYLSKEDFTKAYQLYEELGSQAKQLNQYDTWLTIGLTSKAISGFKSKQLTAQEAMTLIAKSDKALDSLGNTYRRARNKQNLAEILYAEGKINEAVVSALQAKDWAARTNNNDRILKALEFLSQIDEVESRRHSKAYFELNNKLQLQERTIQDKFALIQLETEEVKQENESLAKSNELLGGIAVGLLILGIGVFTIISQRISNQRLKFKQKEQTKNQEIYNLMLSQHGKIEEGKKSEQKRVSEELHDGILGQLLGIRLILSGLNERSDEAAMEQRGELIVKLQEVEEEIRTISHELNASAYKKMHNFILSIADLIASVKKSSSLDIDFQYQNEFQWDSLHSDIKINSYRIIQELLQNSVKHAQCKNVRVVFIKDKNSLNLTVQDDGVGFDDSKVKKGIGLKNITSRVKKIGAQVNVKSQPLQGTAVTITIPNIDLKRQHPKPNNKRNSVVET